MTAALLAWLRNLLPPSDARARVRAFAVARLSERSTSQAALTMGAGLFGWAVDPERLALYASLVSVFATLIAVMTVEAPRE